MAAGRGNLERALGDFLSLDLGKVGAALGGLGIGELGDRAQAGALEVSEKGEQVWCGNHVQLPRPARFAALRRRADQPLVRSRGMDRGEQHARRGRDAPVEAELSDRDTMRQRLGVGRTDGGEQAERDRQVEVRALLREIGR